jgi:hypothetical protein
MNSESPLHEGSAIRLRGMIVFFVWFTISMIVIHILLLGLYKLYVNQAKQSDVRITELSGEVTQTVPPEPRLQPSRSHDTMPAVDMAKMNERDLGEFRRRGWVDEAGEVAIPSQVVQQVMTMSQATTRRTR